MAKLADLPKPPETQVSVWAKKNWFIGKVGREGCRRQNCQKIVVGRQLSVSSPIRRQILMAAVARQNGGGDGGSLWCCWCCCCSCDRPILSHLQRLTVLMLSCVGDTPNPGPHQLPSQAHSLIARSIRGREEYRCCINIINDVRGEWVTFWKNIW